MSVPAIARSIGYPESRSSFDGDITVQARGDPRSHATYIISNLGFDPATISSWVRQAHRLEHSAADRYVFTLSQVAETEVWRRTPLAVYR
jgi:hypothetical protein